MFLVADEQMAHMLRGFLGRDKCHLSLGCGPFDFDDKQDIVVDPTRDPGVYTRGSELLAPFAATHDRAVVMLDAEWEGAPSAEVIRRKIEQDLKVHWRSFMVIVLDPELEAWIWQDNEHVASALGAADFAALRAMVEAADLWDDGAPKPHRPKEAVELALKRARIPRSGAIYRNVASKVTTKHCIDPAFDRLRNGFVDWFGKAA